MQRVFSVGCGLMMATLVVRSYCELFQRLAGGVTRLLTERVGAICGDLGRCARCRKPLPGLHQTHRRSHTENDAPTRGDSFHERHHTSQVCVESPQYTHRHSSRSPPQPVPSSLVPGIGLGDVLLSLWRNDQPSGHGDVGLVV